MMLRLVHHRRHIYMIPDGSTSRTAVGLHEALMKRVEPQRLEGGNLQTRPLRQVLDKGSVGLHRQEAVGWMVVGCLSKCV